MLLSLSVEAIEGDQVEIKLDVLEFFENVRLTALVVGHVVVETYEFTTEVIELLLDAVFIHGSTLSVEEWGEEVDAVDEPECTGDTGCEGT